MTLDFKETTGGFMVTVAYTEQKISTVSEELTGQTPPKYPPSTPQVEDLVKAIDGDMDRLELQKSLNLTDRKNFRIVYLQPALRDGLIELVYADSPNHPQQKYRLTEKGKELKDKIIGRIED